MNTRQIEALTYLIKKHLNIIKYASTIVYTHPELYKELLYYGDTLLILMDDLKYIPKRGYRSYLLSSIHKFKHVLYHVNKKLVDGTYSGSPHIIQLLNRFHIRLSLRIMMLSYILKGKDYEMHEIGGRWYSYRDFIITDIFWMYPGRAEIIPT